MTTIQKRETISKMKTKTCPHCNEVALRNPVGDIADNHICQSCPLSLPSSNLKKYNPMYHCWKCTECYDVFWTRKEGSI